MKFFQKITLLFLSGLALYISTVVFILPIFQKKTLNLTLIPLSPSSTPTPTISPSSVSPSISPAPSVTLSTISKNIVSDTAPWGVAQQVGEHTWTIKVGEDKTMATPLEILDALNNYRINHGSQKLNIDNKLADYAQSRADFFYQKQSLDSHQGFNNFLENEDGFSKLGFTWLGENASLGYQLNGVHLIEWIYASDQYHDKNQLNNVWNYVGIGVKGTATCLIFGTGKM